MHYPIWNLGEAPRQVIANLPYNVGTKMLITWLKYIQNFDLLTLMFQKEVAERIISKFNSTNYGRLSVLSNWKLNIKKVFDVKPMCFSPRPKVESSVLLFEPKQKFIKLKNPKNLEYITRIFFMHRRKMIKKPYYQLFNENIRIASKIGIDLNLRPQNLDFETYFKLTKEYENLRS